MGAAGFAMAPQRYSSPVVSPHCFPLLIFPMKLNLAITLAQVATARKPEIGVESQVYFAPENCQLLGTLTALTSSTGEYVSAGGAAIPTGGRDLLVRCLSPNLLGVGGAMAITFNVTLEGDLADTAVATFHLPTWSAAGSLNQFPIGICSDFVPATPANVAKKVTAVGTLVSVANMTPGNKFQIYTTPNLADFVYIDATTSKGGQFNLPGIVEIPDGYNAAGYTKLGRSESNKLAIGFRDRGYLEQLNRFNGCQGTIRMDVVKDGSVLAQRFLYSGYFVRAAAERGDGDDVVEAKSEGPYDQFLIGYPRAS